jgi:hypothetical protein
MAFLPAVPIDRLTELRTDKQRKETERYKRELKSADKRIAQLDTTIAKLFESSALGKISEERCQTMLQTYEMEQQELKQRRIVLAEAIEQAEKAYSNVENFVELIRRFTDIQELDTHILNSLIDRIVVHEKETLADGAKSQRVDIHYKFIGYMPLGEILMGAHSINGIAVEEILVSWERESILGGGMVDSVVY